MLGLRAGIRGLDGDRGGRVPRSHRADRERRRRLQTEIEPTLRVGGQLRDDLPGRTVDDEREPHPRPGDRRTVGEHLPRDRAIGRADLREPWRKARRRSSCGRRRCSRDVRDVRGPRVTAAPRAADEHGDEQQHDDRDR